MTDILEELENFNLIKYTGHYVLTIDVGMGKPVIIQDDDLGEIFRKLENYTAALYD